MMTAYRKCSLCARSFISNGDEIWYGIFATHTSNFGVSTLFRRKKREWRQKFRAKNQHFGEPRVISLRTCEKKNFAHFRKSE
mmetsp:Transcript_7573/g.33777  ORF Transcript_7573/g.33777 Transcript_7573/m.33777 type:complete len:82 (+) Transcript_7573:1928-2173(+)